MSGNIAVCTLQDICQAVLAIRDAASGVQALNMIACSPLNLNAPAMVDGRGLIDVAVEKFCANFQADKSGLDVDLVHRELYIISTIFSKQVNFYSDTHTLTKRECDMMQARYESIKTKMVTMAGSLTGDFFKLSVDERILFAAYHAFQEIAGITKNVVRMMHDLAIIPEDSAAIKAKMQHKAIVVCADSADAGTIEFLRAIKTRTSAAGYTTLSLDLQATGVAPKKQLEDYYRLMQGNMLVDTAATRNTMALALLGLTSGFKLVPIDPRVYNKGTVAEAQIHALVDLVFGKGYSSEIRGLGMCLAGLKATYDAAGGIIIVVGASHCYKLIRYLNNVGVDTITVAAFLDPNTFKLSKNSHDNYERSASADIRVDLLFTKLPVLPLNMSPETREQALEQFFREFEGSSIRLAAGSSAVAPRLM